MEINIITHGLVANRLREYMRKKGLRVAEKLWGEQEFPRPDLWLYYIKHRGKDGKILPRLAIEIKPAYASREEIIRGIGQCASYLLWADAKPYLVIYEGHLEPDLSGLMDLPELYWLGIITYREDNEKLVFTLAKKSDR